MPAYSYQCNCGVRFEASASMADHQKPKKCPSCGILAPRHLPEDLRGVFSLQTSGIGPQNTGVSDYDMNVDRIIGSDATKGYAAIEERNERKLKVLRENPGAGSRDLSLNPDGTYRIMQKKEKQIHARALTINHLALNALKKKKAET